MAAVITERTTDSKNRRAGATLLSIKFNSKVVDGVVETTTGAIEFDSHIYDLDDGEKGAHLREPFDIALAVQLGVYTVEEAAQLEALIRKGYNAIDYMKENKPQESAE